MRPDLTIIQDTREQRPWVFPEYVRTRVGTLRTGDYALDGDDRFAIERKSLDDFVGTIFSGWERFLREIGRMEGAGFVARVIIIEADYEMLMMREGATGEIIAPCHHHPMITPQAVAGRIADLTMMGVSCLFCRDAGHAALQAYHLFCRRAAQIANESFRR
jgi:ERCC4-type nuclease